MDIVTTIGTIDMFEERGNSYTFNPDANWIILNGDTILNAAKSNPSE